MLTEVGRGLGRRGWTAAGAADRTLAPLLECVGWARNLMDGRWAVSLASDVVGAPEDGPWSGAAGAAESAALIGAWPQPTAAGPSRRHPSGNRRCRRRELYGVAGECSAPGVAPGHVGALASAVGASARGVRLVEQATEGIEHVGGRRRWIGISPRPQVSVLLRLERNAAPSPWPTARVGLQNAASTLISLAAALVLAAALCRTATRALLGVPRLRLALDGNCGHA